jgi:hypothetical protein
MYIYRRNDLYNKITIYRMHVIWCRSDIVLDLISSKNYTSQTIPNRDQSGGIQ